MRLAAAVAVIPYRATIDQPSTAQPHHDLHGKRCIVVEESGTTATVYFTEGPVISMQLLKPCLIPSWRGPQ